MVTALISVSLAPAMWSRIDALKYMEFYSPQLNWTYTIIRVFITVLMVGSRVTAIVIFTAHFRVYILIFIAVYFLAVLRATVTTSIDYDCESLVFIAMLSVCSLVGMDIIFMRYEDEEKDADWISLSWINHLLTILANTTLMVVWYVVAGSHQTLGDITLIIVLSTTIIGFLVDIALRYKYQAATLFSKKLFVTETGHDSGQNGVDIEQS